MTWTVRLLRSAERDIEEGMAWYRRQQPSLDSDFLREVDVAIGPRAYSVRSGDVPC